MVRQPGSDGRAPAAGVSFAPLHPPLLAALKSIGQLFPAPAKTTRASPCAKTASCGSRQRQDSKPLYAQPQNHAPFYYLAADRIVGRRLRGPPAQGASKRQLLPPGSNRRKRCGRRGRCWFLKTPPSHGRPHREPRPPAHTADRLSKAPPESWACGCGSDGCRPCTIRHLPPDSAQGGFRFEGQLAEGRQGSGSLGGRRTQDLGPAGDGDTRPSRRDPAAENRACCGSTPGLIQAR